MAAPKGNKNGLGNRGGGRKPLAVELNRLRELETIWDSPLDIKELKKKVKEQKFSPKERWLMLAIDGDERVLNKMADKIYPETSKTTVDIPQITEALETIRGIVHAARTKAGKGTK